MNYRDYINQGFKIFPCNMDKTPATPHGFKDAGLNWTDKDFKGKLIGLATGQVNGIVVIDLDVKDGYTVESLIEALKEYGPVPDTYTVETPSGGRHLYYKTDNTNITVGTRYFDKKLPIDIRGNGGYVVGCDDKYYFAIDCDITDIMSHLAPLPEWIETFKKTRDAKGLKTNTQFNVEILEGSRNDELARIAGIYRSKGMDETLIFPAVMGHNAIYCKPPLSEKEVRGIVKSICRYDYNKITDKFIVNCFYNEEVGDAELFERQSDGQVLFNTTTGEWLKWENGVWTLQNANQIQNELINRISEPYYRLSKNADNKIVELFKIKESKKKIEEIEAFRDALRKRASSLKRRGRIENVLKLASWKMSESIEAFDTNPLELNLQNGVYDFEADTFREHSKEDRFLKQAGTYFDPEARCPYILEFLNEILQGNSNIIDFLKHIIGIYLTGQTDIQGFIYCYGGGRNGKSTFFNLLKMLMGDYYHTIAIDALLLKNYNQSDEYYRAQMFGKRLIVASEIPGNRKLNESQIKDLTGGEQVNARHPYGKPFCFDPSHKLALFGNHLLNITGTDDAIWRRVFLVNFDYTIPENRVRPMSEIMGKFQDELPGFLNWAIEGYREYKQAGHLVIPDDVKQSTDDYRADSDILGEFMEETTISDIAGTVGVKEIYLAYSEWCTVHKQTQILKTSNRLKKELETRGFKVERGTGNKYYVSGLSIIE